MSEPHADAAIRTWASMDPDVRAAQVEVDFQRFDIIVSSVREITGVPIMFASTGEKLEDFDVFHPDRMASRILGMGDVLTLIERAEAAVEADDQADDQARRRLLRWWGRVGAQRRGVLPGSRGLPGRRVLPRRRVLARRRVLGAAETRRVGHGA